MTDLTTVQTVAKNLVLTVSAKETVIGAEELPIFQLKLPLADLQGADTLAAIVAANAGAIHAQINQDGTIDFSDEVKSHIPIHFLGLAIKMAITVPIHAHLSID